VHPNEALARRLMDVLDAGDRQALADLCTDDCVIHFQGRSHLAGTYRSIDEYLLKLQSLLPAAIVKRELHDALGSDDHAVQLLRSTVEIDGRAYSFNAAVVMNVRHGKVSEAWVHQQGDYALDGFLASVG
jgi:ketosteroid isomerase-like protein